MHPLCSSFVWQFPLPIKCIFKHWPQVRAFVASPKAFTLTYGKESMTLVFWKGNPMVCLAFLTRQTHRRTDAWTDVLHGLRRPAVEPRPSAPQTNFHPSWLRTLRCDSQLSPQRPWTQSFFNYTRAFTKKLTWTAIQWLKHKPYLYFISVFQSFLNFFFSFSCFGCICVFSWFKSWFAFLCSFGIALIQSCAESLSHREVGFWIWCEVGRKKWRNGLEEESEGQWSGDGSRYGFIVSPDMDSPAVTGMAVYGTEWNDELVWERWGLKVMADDFSRLSTIRGGVWCCGGWAPPTGSGSPGSLRPFRALWG